MPILIMMILFFLIRDWIRQSHQDAKIKQMEKQEELKEYKLVREDYETPHHLN